MIVLDPADHAFEEALLTLANKLEEELPGLDESKLGLSNILTKVFYIIESVIADDTNFWICLNASR